MNFSKDNSTFLISQYLILVNLSELVQYSFADNVIYIHVGFEYHVDKFLHKPA